MIVASSLSQELSHQIARKKLANQKWIQKQRDISEQAFGSRCADFLNRRFRLSVTQAVISGHLCILRKIFNDMNVQKEMKISVKTSKSKLLSHYIKLWQKTLLVNAEVFKIIYSTNKTYRLRERLFSIGSLLDVQVYVHQHIQNCGHFFLLDITYTARWCS